MCDEYDRSTECGEQVGNVLGGENSNGGGGIVET